MVAGLCWVDQMNIKHGFPSVGKIPIMQQESKTSAKKWKKKNSYAR